MVPRNLDLLDADGWSGMIRSVEKIFIGGGEETDSSQLFSYEVKAGIHW